MFQAPQIVERHYTIKEITEICGFSRTKLNRLVQSGQIKKIKVGRSVLFSASEINRFLQECANNAKN